MSPLTRRPTAADTVRATGCPPPSGPTPTACVLTPDLHGATFTGDVEIDVTVDERRDRDRPQRRRARGHLRRAQRPRPRRRLCPVPAAIALDDDEERVTLTFAEPLAPGPATLHLTFTGILNDKLHGFYRSTFTDEDGVEHVIATTQMESTDARRAFPCFDEPERKAVFRDHPGGRRRPGRLLQRAGGRGDARARRRAAGAVRADHGHVHLPGGLRRRPARGHRAGATSTGCRCASSTPGQGPPDRLRPRGRRPTPSGSSPTTSASPTRPTSSTWWPSPTSPSGPWRTSAA